MQVEKKLNRETNKYWTTCSVVLHSSCTFLFVSLYICVYNPRILNIKIYLLVFITDEYADFKEMCTRCSVEAAEE